MAVARGTALPYPPPRGLADPAPAPAPEPVTPAVTVTAQQIAAETNITVERATRLLAVATEHVERYAPNAPTVLLNEACIRYCGYLGQSGYGEMIEQELGPKRLAFTTNHAAAFRNCGAAALLTGHKRRRAGAIG